MRKNYRKQQISIYVVDLLLMYASLIAALVARNHAFPSIWLLREHVVHFSIIFAGWSIVFYTIGLYQLERPFDNVKFLRRILMGVLVAGLASAGYFYLIPGISIEPKTVLLLFVVIYTIVFWAWRYSLGKLRKLDVLRSGVGFVGLNASSSVILNETLRRSALGYDIKLVYEPPAGIALPEGARVVTALEDFRPAVEATDTDLIILSEQTALSNDLQRVLFGLLDRRVRYMRLSEFYELVVRRVPVGLINESWFLENIDLRSKKAYETVKRAADIGLALVSLVLLAPLWPCIAIAIRLGGRGPIFFCQTRLGRHNKPFTILKFRTMRTERNNLEPTGTHDPRVTSVGKFLRASRLDETPQVINILKGDMSFIGPRPERPEIAYMLEKVIPYYSERHLVKPGITGWDQVSGEYHSPSVVDTNKKLQYDLYYVKNMSLYLDVSIFFKTIVTVLKREGQ